MTVFDMGKSTVKVPKWHDLMDGFRLSKDALETMREAARATTVSAAEMESAMKAVADAACSAGMSTEEAVKTLSIAAVDIRKKSAFDFDKLKSEVGYDFDGFEECAGVGQEGMLGASVRIGPGDAVVWNDQPLLIIAYTGSGDWYELQRWDGKTFLFPWFTKVRPLCMQMYEDALDFIRRYRCPCEVAIFPPDFKLEITSVP